MDVAVSDPPHLLDNAARRFVINVMSSSARDYEVRSCEITCDAFRNRTSFQNAVTLDEVFKDEVAAGLKSCLRKLSGETEVVALPSFVLEIPGLTLAGAQMVATKTSDDVMHIIIRFRFFVGGINNVFRPKLGFDDTLNDHAANLSVRVLSDLALPFLNICEAYKSGLIDVDADFADFVVGLSQRSQELRFQVELLKRFVDATEKSEMPDPHAHIDHINVARLDQSFD